MDSLAGAGYIFVMHQPSDHPEELLDRLHARCRVAVLTGAGISAASGIPTFRGKDGIWNNHAAEQLATPEAFGNDPVTVWEWYAWRRGLVAAARPNPAHLALADLAGLVGRLGIITQNVDGLHGLCQAVGSELIEIHGSIWRVRCQACGQEREDRDETLGATELPRCSCGGVERPGVVWFGEELAPESLRRAHELASTAEVFLVVGTSAQVQPAASFAAVAAHAGAFVAEFNLETTPASRVCHALINGPCEQSLPEIVTALGQGRGERA